MATFMTGNMLGMGPMDADNPGPAGLLAAISSAEVGWEATAIEVC